MRVRERRPWVSGSRSERDRADRASTGSASGRGRVNMEFSVQISGRAHSNARREPRLSEAGSRTLDGRAVERPTTSDGRAGTMTMTTKAKMKTKSKSGRVRASRPKSHHAHMPSTSPGAGGGPVTSDERPTTWGWAGYDRPADQCDGSISRPMTSAASRRSFTTWSGRIRPSRSNRAP